MRSLIDLLLKIRMFNLNQVVSFAAMHYLNPIYSYIFTIFLGIAN